MKKEWNTVEVLRHVRHDWLNKLQLIKGNIDLNKIERVREIINEIVLEAQNDSKLSNLNIPRFTCLLLTHNWDNYPFQIEFEVMNDLKYGCIDDEKYANWTSTFFTCLNKSIKLYYDNHLFVSIEPQQQGLRFFFDFSGILENKVQIERFLQNTPVGITVQSFDMTENEFTLEILTSYMVKAE